ncbi:MAG TPA: xanthine dehydrogenase family protein molybdopterin-binding subunit [Paracoccaceae bacterium]|nr:xanthine dehydrogenase family protein molybdopterin-binding subunit [Paracoccaceae bacterium]
MTVTAQNGDGWIGRAMARREDAALLTGRGQFVDDIPAPGALFAAFVRCPAARQRVVTLDLAPCLSVPGVVAAFDAGGLGLTQGTSVNPLLPLGPVRPGMALASGTVLAAGEALAVVLAETQAAAIEGAEAAVVETEDIPAGDPALPDPTPFTLGAWQDGPPPPDPCAVHAVEVTIGQALVAPMALEPRAALAAPDGDGGGLTVWLALQTPHRAREDLARILGLPGERVRVIAPDVGGAFGGKASLSPEDIAVAAAALRLGRPVRWTATRSEEFLAATLGRGMRSEGRLTLDASGRMLRLAARHAVPFGAWTPHSAHAPARNAARILPGPYAVPAVDVALTGRSHPIAAVNIYRGAGRPEAAMLLERLADRAARAAGLDPLDLRLRNLRGPGDAWETPGGAVIDRVDPTGLLRRLEGAADYRARRAGLAARRAAGEVAGLGLALYVEPCGQGWESASVTLLPGGRFRLATGASAQGQGRATAFAQIAADGLGCHPDRIEVAAGDTAAIATGIGALASRSTAIGGAAVVAACERLRAQVAVALPGLQDWDGIAAALADRPDLTRAEAVWTAEAEAWAAGAVLAEAVIDPETGAVAITRIDWAEDAGRAVNPMLVEGQLIGGAAQGLGTALMEAMAHDPAGQVMTGSLMDYAVPRAADIPLIRIHACPTPGRANPMGVKGVGEAGCIGVPAAILNAVMDALPPGTPDLPLPLTPLRVWRALTGGPA